MIKFNYFLCLIFCFVFQIKMQAQNQEVYIKHTVQNGETIQDIAQKYRVTPYDIYRINPDSRNEIKEKTILLIPNSFPQNLTHKNITEINNVVTHKILPQETFYGIAQQYGVTIQSIQEANKDVLLSGLQPGQILIIPKAQLESEVIQTIKQNDTLFHMIKPQETAFGVAKQYGITVQKLEELNPILKDGFKIGDKIIVRIKNESVVSKHESSIDSQPIHPKEEKFHRVLPNETLFGLSKSYKVTQEALIQLNPELSNGIREGMQIKIPSHTLYSSTQNQISKLASTINNRDRLKDLVILLPFNLDKIENDSLSNLQNQSKKDPFLSMTLDYYSGVLMAIDSANSLGIKMKVKILDSKENKNSSDISNIFASHHWNETGVVLGPFYPHAVELTARLFGSKKIPVISPLRETNQSLPYLYQSMPTQEHIRQNMFQYILSKKGNLLAAVDANRGSTRQFLSQKGGVSFIGHDENGHVSKASINGLLKKNMVNYVVFDSKKTVYILNLLNALLDNATTYQIKLVSLEKNEALDFDEISIVKLAKLNLMYPSITNDIETSESSNFYGNYRKRYSYFPSQFAIRGFDVTLDVILRMAQNEGFVGKGKATELIANKFDYIPHLNGFVNQGIYIFEYQDDLTIKLAE